MSADRLEPFEVFAGLAGFERAAVLEGANELVVEAGHEPARMGEFGYALFAIEEGTAEVSAADGQSLGTLGPGDIFGEIVVLVTGRRTATVVARTPMRLLTFFAQDIDRIRRQQPGIERALREIGGRRLAP